MHFNFLYHKFPHYYICRDLFIGCFIHVCRTSTTILCNHLSVHCGCLCVFSVFGTGEKDLLCALFSTFEVQMRCSPECVKSPVPRGTMSSGSKINVICRHLLEEIGKAWEGKWVVLIIVIWVNGDLFGTLLVCKAMKYNFKKSLWEDDSSIRVQWKCIIHSVYILID